MRRRQACLLLAASALTIPNITFADWPRSVDERVRAREFPSVFQAWNGAEHVQDASPLDTAARHDLLWNVPEYFGLQWNSNYRLAADGFVASSVSAGLAMRAALLERNPNMVLLGEVRWHDAQSSELPDDSAWWQRDARRQRIVGWSEGNQYLLDWRAADFRAHVALQAAAVCSTGVVDGVVLDWWSTDTDDPDRLALVQTVRESIGPDALILVNAGWTSPFSSAPYINGLYMETTIPHTLDEVDEWRRATETLVWAEQNLRTPTLNAFETWNARSSLNRMRATTSLVLTQSDGYSLFADPNDLPTPDHLHDWYAFWDRSLGRPLASGVEREDGAFQREFDYGTVVYNPIGNAPVEVTFPVARRSAATRQVATSFVLPALDGDLYLT
jgi:hypothetical protein